MAGEVETTPMPNDRRFVRRARALKTLRAMVHLYCEGNHHADRSHLCPECAELMQYATRRLQRCVFGDVKPNCADCRVHCYRAEMREKVRIVMRWAGPRMLLRHPILSVFHLLAGRAAVPTLPAPPARTAVRHNRRDEP